MKISDEVQLAAPGDSVTVIVELQDLKGTPKPKIDVNFVLFVSDTPGSLDPGTATTDADGRAQTTLQLPNDAEGTYEVEAYRSDDFGVYISFRAVTVDTSPPVPTGPYGNNLRR